ncbi:hypothetical protein MASR1M50_30020 [Burkholderiales bacterium]
MLAHLVGGQVVARELDHGGLLAAALELALALDVQGGRQLVGRLRGQPAGHGRLRRARGLQQVDGKALARHAHQAGDDFVGLALRAGVEHQPALARRHPHRHLGATRKGLGQQRGDGVVAQIAQLFLAGLAAAAFLDFRHSFIDLAAHGVARHGLGFDGETRHPLAVDGFDQRAVVLAARRHPAGGFLLRGAALGKRLARQRFFELSRRRGPARAQAVEHQILEHEIQPVTNAPRGAGPAS